MPMLDIWQHIDKSEVWIFNIYKHHEIILPVVQSEKWL